MGTERPSSSRPASRCCSAALRSCARWTAVAPRSSSPRRRPSSPRSPRATAAARCSSIRSPLPPRSRTSWRTRTSVRCSRSRRSRTELPAGVARVLLDESPARALVRIGGEERTVDLGAHVGLELEGAGDAPGRNEEAAIVYTSAMAGTPLGAVLTHRNLLANARATVEAAALDAQYRVARDAPLRASLRIHRDPHGAAARRRAGDHHGALQSAARPRRAAQRGGVAARWRALRVRRAPRGRGAPGGTASPRPRCACASAAARRSRWSSRQRWHAATGVALRQGYGLTEAAPVCLFNRMSLPTDPAPSACTSPASRSAIRDRRDLRARRECLPRLRLQRRRRPARDRRLAPHRRPRHDRRRRLRHLHRPRQGDVHPQRLQHLSARRSSAWWPPCPACAP